MGNPKEDVSLVPLHKILEALKEIKQHLMPFLRLLKNNSSAPDTHQSKLFDSNSLGNVSRPKKRNRSKTDDSDEEEDKSTTIDPHRRAEAEAAVALAIGTLRYMGARLRGLDQGRKKGDPLRVELDKIRGILVSLRNLENKENGKSGDDSDGNGGRSSTINAKGVTTSEATNDAAKINSNKEGTKRRKLSSLDAGQRMINAALSSNKHPK